jgi:hypothetical protein
MWDNVLVYRLTRDRVELQNIDALTTLVFSGLITEVLQSSMLQEQLCELRIARALERSHRTRTEPELAQLFRSLKGLRQLKDLELLQFSGEAMPTLLEFLQQQNTLTSFQLSTPPGDNSFDYAGLALALSNIPTLREVEVSVAASTQMETLLHSSYSLQSLAIRDGNNEYVSVDKLCSSIALALHNNRTLQYFNFEKSMGPTGVLAICSMLKVNRSLKKLDLSFTCAPSDMDPLLQAIASALKVNTTMTDLFLSCESSTPPSKKGKDAILDMLLHNYSLQHFRILEDDAELDAQKDFYLKLNSIGRGKLLQRAEDSSKQQWVDMLVQQKDDLDCLFYFLSANPSLCATTLPSIVPSSGMNKKLQLDQKTYPAFQATKLRQFLQSKPSPTTTTTTNMQGLPDTLDHLQQQYENLDRRNCDLNRRNFELKQQLDQAQNQMRQAQDQMTILQQLANRAIDLAQNNNNQTSAPDGKPGKRSRR